MQTTDILGRLTGILVLITLTLLLLIVALLFENFSEKEDSLTFSQNTENQSFVTEKSTENLLRDTIAEAGKALFKANCNQCHAITDEVVVGPGLKGITERREEKWLLAWIKNPQKVLNSKDEYALELFKKFGNAQMSSFESLTVSEIRSILVYVKSGESGEVE